MTRHRLLNLLTLAIYMIAFFIVYADFMYWRPN